MTNRSYFGTDGIRGQANTGFRSRQGIRESVSSCRTCHDHKPARDWTEWRLNKIDLESRGDVAREGAGKGVGAGEELAEAQPVQMSLVETVKLGDYEHVTLGVKDFRGSSVSAGAIFFNCRSCATPQPL